MSRTITKAINQEWDELVETIPDDLDASAKEHAALLRRRGVQSASDLLRLNLMYATILSLRNTALWAACLGLCDISRQAIERRVLNSTPWLRHVLGAMLNKVAGVPPSVAGFIRRLILVDGSVIARPGSPGTEWRIHLGWQPFAQQPAEAVLSDAQQGEGFEQMNLQAGDLVVADRGYGI